jgi:hypothetical protein
MRRLLVVLPVLAGVVALTGGTAAAPSGAAPVHHGAPIAVLKASQSTNWWGYNQGALETGKSPFHAVTANWTVPRATQHKKGEDEYSATWAGIGGGCVESTCTVTDNTLIQAGTEQDVVGGKPQYSAWWELIPAPGITIDTMTVRPGDRFHLDIHEVTTNSELWSITLTNVTRHQTFTQTVPYPSTYGSVEWVNETPLLLGSNAGLAALPNLTKTVFDSGTANGANPHLVAGEAIDLATSAGAVYAVPSAPDRDTDGAGLCAWATACTVPAS